MGLEGSHSSRPSEGPEQPAREGGSPCTDSEGPQLCLPLRLVTAVRFSTGSFLGRTQTPVTSSLRHSPRAGRIPSPYRQKQRSGGGRRTYGISKGLNPDSKLFSAPMPCDPLVPPSLRPGRQHGERTTSGCRGKRRWRCTVCYPVQGQRGRLLHWDNTDAVH